jgi:hypothetical protein
MARRPVRIKQGHGPRRISGQKMGIISLNYRDMTRVNPGLLPRLH